MKWKIAYYDLENNKATIKLALALVKDMKGGIKVSTEAYIDAMKQRTP